jgi:hypothetical protein
MTAGPLGVVSCSSFAPMSARSVTLETFPIWVRGSASMSSRRSQRPLEPACPHEVAGTVEALGDLDLGAGSEHPDFIKGRDRDTDGLGPEIGGRIERGEQEEPLAHAEGLGNVDASSGQLVEDPTGDAAAVNTQVPSRVMASSNAGCDRHPWPSPGGLMVQVAPCSAISGSMTSAAGVAFPVLSEARLIQRGDL